MHVAPASAGEIDGIVVQGEVLSSVRRDREDHRRRGTVNDALEERRSIE